MARKKSTRKERLLRKDGQMKRGSLKKLADILKAINDIRENY